MSKRNNLSPSFRGLEPVKVQFKKAWVQGLALVRPVSPRTWGPQAWVLAPLWTAAIVLDAWSTLHMMSTGYFEEANGVAAHGMGVFGRELYVLLASLVCALLALFTLRKPTGIYSWTMALTAGVILLIKFAIGLNNLSICGNLCQL